MKLGPCWMKVEGQLISVICISGGDTPLVLEPQSFESWQNLGNLKIGSNLGAHNLFWSYYAIVKEITPKWSPFQVLWGDVNCWWYPIRIWSNPVLKLIIIMENVNLAKFQSPVSPQQKRHQWWDLHENGAHSIYFLMTQVMRFTHFVILHKHSGLLSCIAPNLYGVSPAMLISSESV